MPGSDECLFVRGICSFPLAFMTQGNGTGARFRRWLKLTAAPLTAINRAAQGGYQRGETVG